MFVDNSKISSIPAVPCELTPISSAKTQQHNTEGVNKYNTFHALSHASQHYL